MKTSSIASHLVVCAVLCGTSVIESTASAQHLMVGGPDTLIRRALPVTDDFSIVGACGGIVESMVAVGEITYIGDRTGILYRHDPGVGVTYSFNTSNDAVALASDGQRLFVGGSNGSVECYDLATELLLDVWRGPAGLRALTVVGTELFGAGDSGLIVRTSLAGPGVFTAFADALLPVTAMTVHEAALLVGSPSGTITRLSLSSGTITSSFSVGADVTALGVNLGQLLVAGSDGVIRRVDSADGTIFDTATVGSTISAIALTDGFPPAWTYCYGIQCPCGNDDALAGCVNSTGRGARLTAAGTTRAVLDDFTLFMTGAPASTTAVVFMGAQAAHDPLGGGILCINPSFGIQRFAPMQTSEFGALVLGGLGQHAQTNFSAAFQITAGSDWHFQVWYRDVGGSCGSSSNTTNTAQVLFTP